MIRFTIPIRTYTPVNGSQGGWQMKAKRRQNERTYTLVCMRRLGVKWEAPAVITLTRVGKGVMDDDNLRPALKSIRDQIAEEFGCDDRTGGGLTFRYEQRKGKVYAVEVEIETVQERCCESEDTPCPTCGRTGPKPGQPATQDG